MKFALNTAVLAVAAALAAPLAFAEPEYARIEMQIDVAKPAADVWAKVGKYCDLGAWMKIDCTITSGDGGIGTVRSIAGGRVTEVLVGKTDLSYGYVMPPVEGRPYNLYHGFLEAKALTPTTSRLVYTLMYDVSLLADQAAKEADKARRRTQFEGALKSMKALAEAQ